jgi:hypothetical protein
MLPLKKHNPLADTAAFCFILIATIGPAITSATSQEAYPAIRAAAIVLFVAIIAWWLTVSRAKSQLLIFVVFVMCLYGVGLARASDDFFERSSLWSVCQTLFLIIAGGLVMSMSVGFRHRSTLPLLCVLYGIILLVSAEMTGGLVLLPIPSFVYDIYDASGSQSSYSQGVSFVFGLVAIASFYGASRAGRGSEKLLYFVATAAFSMFCFIGGGRGEFVFFVVTLLSILIVGRSGALLRMALILLPFIYLTLPIIRPILADLLSETVAFGRFSDIVMSSDLGHRDVLFGQALMLLWEKPECFLAGCGISYFQDFYGYEQGMYPHNIVLESILTWGVLVFLSVAGFAWVGWKGALEALGLIFWFGVYALLVSLKSGDLLSNWLAVSFVLFLAGRGCLRTFSRHPQSKLIDERAVT